MCITTIQKEPQVATKPITVWKFLRKDHSSCANSNFLYKEGEVAHVHITKSLSSFKDKESAERFLHADGKICIGGHSISPEDLVVREMVIPEGAKYYTGVFEWVGSSINADLEGFESDSLFFPKIL